MVQCEVEEGLLSVKITVWRSVKCTNKEGLHGYDYLRGEQNMKKVEKQALKRKERNMMSWILFSASSKAVKLGKCF